MKTLILMRHAKSDWSLSEPDHNRPLNPRGIRSARALGDWLRAQGIAPDMALVSTARRTRETYGLLCLDLEAQFEAQLYNAAPETMLELIKRAEGDTVIMVAHNPGTCMLAHALAARAPGHDRWEDFPTGATAMLRFEGGWSTLRPGTAEVTRFVTPRELETL